MTNPNAIPNRAETLNIRDCVFFIGGNDLEMQEIRKLLQEKGIESTSVADENLGWGAKASEYTERIEEAIKNGLVPVMIELDQDITIPEDAKYITIDHHGNRSEEPSSILQICKLLGVEPTRRMQLVAANDAGWIPGLRAIGATDEEISAIRAEDRRAQGFDEALENLSAELAERAVIDGSTGLAISRDLPISRFAGIKDRLALKGHYNIVCVALPQEGSTSGEMEFQGDGALCKALYEEYKGWSGGEGLGKQGGIAFWGGYPEDPEKVIEKIKQDLSQKKSE